MTMTDVEISHTRPARSPDTKAAIKYFEASGATAITVTDHDGVCTFRVGTRSTVSGLLTAPCGDFDKSADVDRFGEIGSHIWSTIYLTVRGRVAV